MERAQTDPVGASNRRPEHSDSLLGILGGPDIAPLDGEAFRDAVDRAWDAAAREARAPADGIVKP